VLLAAFDIDSGLEIYTENNASAWVTFLGAFAIKPIAVGCATTNDATTKNTKTNSFFNKIRMLQSTVLSIKSRY